MKHGKEIISYIICGIKLDLELPCLSMSPVLEKYI